MKAYPASIITLIKIGGREFDSFYIPMRRTTMEVARRPLAKKDCCV